MRYNYLVMVLTKNTWFIYVAFNVVTIHVTWV